MSNYLMSDIHGDLKAFLKLLKKIDFKEGEDFLIVNGDVVDRGEHGIEILTMVKRMVENGSAIMLKGNHELFAQMYMEEKLTERDWILFSGEATLRDLKKLDDKKKEELLEFIKQMPLYLEKDIYPFGNTVITHSGLMEDCLITKPDGSIDVVSSIDSAIEKDEYQLLISADIHYWEHEKRSKLDKYIICGHVPTYQLGPEYKGKIFQARAYMDVDAGAGYREQGGRLACYCIDNGKTLYI